MSIERHRSESTQPPVEERRRPQGAAPQAGGEAAGGVSSNTPPSNHHFAGISAGGEDWLELSLYCLHLDFGCLSNRLDAAKQAAEENRSPADEITLAGVRFVCLPGTARAGKGRKRIAYRWRLESEYGVVLMLMHRAEPHETMPNVIARATSLPLLRHGTQGCWEVAIKALAAMRVAVQRVKLSRVDPCVDLGGVAVDAFSAAFDEGRYVSRPRRSLRHMVETTVSDHRVSRKPCGFTLGGGEALVRVYDKHRELCFAPEKLRLMLLRRYGEPAFYATRVEFQLRRGKLKDLGVDSLEDWFDKRAAICAYLTHEWVRLTADEVDRSHPERASTLAEWTLVQDRFSDWCGSPGDAVLAPLPTAPPNVDHLRKQCLGLLTTILVHERRLVDSNHAFIHEGFASLTEAVEGRWMSSEFRRRAFDLNVPLNEFLQDSDRKRAGEGESKQG